MLPNLSPDRHYKYHKCKESFKSWTKDKIYRTYFSTTNHWGTELYMTCDKKNSNDVPWTVLGDIYEEDMETHNEWLNEYFEEVKTD